MAERHPLQTLWRLIRTNLSAFLVFQLIIVYSVLLLGFFRFLFVQLIKSQLGVDLLVQDNFKALLHNPTALALTALLLLIELFFLLFALIGNYRIFAASIRGARIGALALLKECLTTYVQLFTPRRVLIVPVIVLTMMFSYMTLYTSNMDSFEIPEFLLEWIASKPTLALPFIAVRVLMTFIWVLTLFVMTGIFLENEGFRAAMKKNARLLRTRKGAYLSFLFGLVFGMPLLKSALYGAMLGVAYLFNRDNHMALTFGIHSANWVASIVIPILTDVLQVGIVVTAYCLFFGKRVAQPAPEPDKALRRKDDARRRLPILVMIALIFGFHMVENPDLSFLTPAEEPQIVAHRAGGTFGQENSLKALKDTERSKLAKAVEIDVQLTKDGHVILNHDESLKRLTGVDKRPAELTLEEIRKLKTPDGKGQFTGPPPPTLDEFLDRCKRVDVMIELKDPGHTDALLDKVLETVKAKKFEKRTIIASMDRKALEKSKAKAPHLPTVLITTILIGAEFNDAYIDGFSIEAKGVGRSLVSRAHAMNKKIYVWTVNTYRGVRTAMRARPDGIVTDNVYYTDYAIHATDDDILFQSKIMLFFLEKDPALDRLNLEDELLPLKPPPGSEDNDES